MRSRIIEGFRDELERLRFGMPGGGNPKAVTEIAGSARSLIITRTQRGLGADNKPFTPYSKKPYYAPIDRRPPGYPKPTGGRSKSLRTGKAMKSVFYSDGYGGYKSGIGRGTKVTLTVSGQMLGAIQIATVSAEDAHLFFAGREQAAKAHGHEEGTVVPKRPFFDVSDVASEAQLARELLRHLKEVARQAKLNLKGGVI